jgi:hypothetical protein
MRIRLLPSLALATLVIPAAVACGGTETPDGVGGAGGTTGGTAGVGGAMGGTAGQTSGGTAGTGGSLGGTGGATGGAGSGGAAGSAAGSGGAAGSAAGSGGAAGSAAGSSGAAGSSAGSGAGGGATDSPSDTSQAGLEAFFMAMSHRGADWRANAEMPVGDAEPHTLNRIWYNRTLRQSSADGKGATGMPHSTGAMVVKEIYTGTGVIGHAAMLRTATAWIYYCKASEAGRCSSSSMPNQASYAMSAGSCACHGAGTIVTGDMIPAP